jgi:hypothetical protein
VIFSSGPDGLGAPGPGARGGTGMGVGVLRGGVVWFTGLLGEGKVLRGGGRVGLGKRVTLWRATRRGGGWLVGG